MSEFADNFSYSSGSEDDAPGEVSSSAARDATLSQVRSDRQNDKEVKDREREKRRNRNDMFTAQKKQKLETFGERALPEDVLEAVSTKLSKVDEEIEEALEKLDDDDDNSGDDSEGESGSDSLDEDDVSDDDDFIALDSTSKKNTLNVVTVQDPKKNTSSIEKAMDFRNSRLFKGPNAPNRHSDDTRRVMMQKKKMLRKK